MTNRNATTLATTKKVVTTFYSLYQQTGIPPSAQELATHLDRNKWVVSRHLNRAVELHMLEYRMEPGSKWGVRGFRMWHPVMSKPQEKQA